MSGTVRSLAGGFGLTVLLFSTVHNVQAQTGCTSQTQTANLNALRDSQAAGSITPQTMRNVECSHPGVSLINASNTFDQAVATMDVTRDFLFGTGVSPTGSQIGITNYSQLSTYFNSWPDWAVGFTYIPVNGDLAYIPQTFNSTNYTFDASDMYLTGVVDSSLGYSNGYPSVVGHTNSGATLPVDGSTSIPIANLGWANTTGIGLGTVVAIQSFGNTYVSAIVANTSVKLTAFGDTAAGTAPGAGMNFVIPFAASPLAATLSLPASTINLTTNPTNLVTGMSVNFANGGSPDNRNQDYRVTSIQTPTGYGIVLGSFQLTTSTGGIGSGFTSIGNGDFMVTEYKTYTSPQTSLSVPLSSGTANGAIADAFGSATAAVPTLDGTAHGASSSASSITATLTTANAGDTIVLFMLNSGNETFSAPTSAHLTFTKRGGIATSPEDIEEWVAVAPSALTSEVITAAIPFGTAYITMDAVALKGLTVAQYDDAGPVTTTGASPSITTNNPAAGGVTVSVSPAITYGASAGTVALFMPPITNGALYSKDKFTLSHDSGAYAFDGYFVAPTDSSGGYDSQNTNTLTALNAAPSNFKWGSWWAYWLYESYPSGAYNQANEIDFIENYFFEGPNNSWAFLMTDHSPSPITNLYLNTASPWSQGPGGSPQYAHWNGGSLAGIGPQVESLSATNNGSPLRISGIVTPDRTYRYINNLLVEIQSYTWGTTNPAQAIVNNQIGNMQNWGAPYLGIPQQVAAFPYKLGVRRLTWYKLP